jgi:hypothetical protein
MPKKKPKTTPSKKASNKAQPPPKRAVPPPDNPFLRTQSEHAVEESGIEGEDKQAAELRAKAFEQAREMPTPEDVDS